MANCLSSVSDTPSTEKGNYVYETYKKMPYFGSVGNWDKIQKSGKMNEIATLLNNGNLEGFSNALQNVLGRSQKSAPERKGAEMDQLILNNSISIQNRGSISNEGNHLINMRNIQNTSMDDYHNLLPAASVRATYQNLLVLSASHRDAVIKKVLKSNYDELIRKYRDTDKKYEDPSFPPNKFSLGNMGNETNLDRIKWKRCTEAIDKPVFVEGKITPNDILQGQLGDCYFLAAIAALAEVDARIKRLFPSLEINKNGIYMARVYVRGVLQEVVVDNFIPVDQRGKPRFARPSKGKQIWVIVLQKCWAKVYGSYGAIIGGLPNEVLHNFSGAPTITYLIDKSKKQEQDLIWEQMANWDKRGAILCCGTRKDVDIKSGIVASHAYTILSIFDFPFRLLKVRNPWGEHSWEGKASEKDNQFWNRISPSDKQRMGYDPLKKDNGVFFILFEDFVTYFDIVNICKIDDNANYNYLSVDFNFKNATFFALEVRDNLKSMITIGLTQDSLRGQGQEAQQRGYFRATIIVAKVINNYEGKGYQFVASGSDNSFASQYLELQNLDAGIYVIYSKFVLPKESSIQATICTYTSRETTLLQVKQFAFAGMLEQTMLDHAIKNPEKQAINENKSYGWISKQLLLRNGGIGYLAFNVGAQNPRMLQVQFQEDDFTKSKLSLKKPYKGLGKAKFIVKPGETKILVFKVKASNYPSTLAIPSFRLQNL